MEEFYAFVTAPQSMVALFSAISVFITIVMLANPIVERQRMSDRLKAVATERERIRARERARLASAEKGDGKQSYRKEQQQALMQRIVNKFNLRAAFDDGSLSRKLQMAGFRGQRPVIVFLFARFVLPFVFLAFASIYIFVFGAFAEQSLLVRGGACLFVAYLGFLVPGLYLKNVTQNRQQSIQRAFPDALDLLLICVESGMSVEAAFKRVSEEVGQDSQALAEEFALTTAELSFLEKRIQAYENLATRTGLDGVKACTMALMQAEKYGTPIGAALRVMAQENRDMRMNAAEHKAASLPPKLTVPMIVFFLPVLFLIIGGPIVIQLVEDGLL
ncbi:MAG: type II secretion system F family protein [Pseudomonadota bacterium]